MKRLFSPRSFALLAIVMALFVASVCMHAVPAKPGMWKVLKLVDGTEVRAEFKGDEYCHYWQSADEKIYIRSSQKGLYELVDKSTLRARARMADDNPRVMPYANRIASQSVLTGSHRGLVILVDYPDKNIWGKRKYEFQKEHTKDFYEWIINTKTSLMSSVEGQKLIDAGYPGSVFDYFYTQSNGKFNIQFDIVGPYTLSHNREYYGANDSDIPVKDNPKGPRKMVLEACELADTDPKMDFTKYDWNNDGYIDLVFVLYAGVGEATNQDEEDAVWPQRAFVLSDHYYQTEELKFDSPWTIDGKAHSLLFDGKRLFQFACAGELEGTTGGGIGCFCHEFSHCLGLMDHYVVNDPNANSASKSLFALGHWDIMDSGNYNGNGKVPPCYNSFEKAYLGWLDPIEVDDVSIRVRGLKPYSEGGDAYKLKNHANENEYYLIENRQKTGWDKALPGSGVLITHMDYDEVKYINYINDGDDRVRFKVIPSDNKATEDTEAGDTYPNKTTQNNRLDDTSSPSNEVFNQNIDKTKHLGYSVKNISVSGDGLASFDIISKFGNEANADVNRDNKVNVADVVFVGNVLSNDGVDDETWRSADADGNGEPNADDIQFIVKTIMGKDTRFANVIPDEYRSKIEKYMPIYDGVHPPKIEGVFKIKPMVAVYCEDGGYSPGQVYGTNVITFANQDMEKNTVDFSHYFEGKNEKGSAPGSFVSGYDNHFTAFSINEGITNGVNTKSAVFVSGTITDDGIKDAYYGLLMLDKGPDPYGRVMKVGYYRIYKDRDGLSEPVK